MLSTSKSDIIWSPVHHDKFIVWGHDITLYEVARIKDIEKKTSYTQISSTRGATVVASQSGNGVRCVDISAISDQPDPILALGLESGRVTLTSLKQAYDPLGLIGKEFAARYPRACNSVAWSHTESNLLAVGMDKHRADNCVLLWDMNASDEITGEMGAGDRARAVAERGAGDAVQALAWCGFAPRTLAVCLNLRHVKMFDLRESGGKAAGVAAGAGSTRWMGVCAEREAYLLAARGDSALGVWDARSLHSPLLMLPQPRPPRKVQWCPTRRNLLLSLRRDSSTLRLHDIQRANDFKSPEAVDTAAGSDEGGAGEAVEREVSPGGGPLASFACHPAHRARLLALATGGALLEHTVGERVTLAWGAGGALVWAAGGHLRAPPTVFAADRDDLAQRTRRRAEADYGLKVDLWQNAELAEDEELAGLWHFLALSKSLVEDGCIRNGGWKHPGVRCVLPGAGEGSYRSEATPALLPDMPSRKVLLYRSPERTRALQLLGWGWGWENALAGVERAEAEGRPCRAAALAVFHLRVRTALDVLSRARSPRLRVAALALAAGGGAPDERLWRDSLAAAAPALPDPYLRALLHFLAATVQAHPDFSAVLNETEMRLEDRVAFACLYLSDRHLHEYVERAHAGLSERGALAGVVLCGLGTDGLTLLQRWLERTGDVQSAALLAARCCPPDLVRDARVQRWLAAYRALLDGWRMWWARCALDTWLGAADGEERTRRVAVACTYCGKCVAAAPSARVRPPFARLPPPAAKMKVSSCPHCRKPLPRCGVCSLHLGTSAVGGAGGAVGGAPFDTWFSWCVACRHGGHAAHLLHWFSEHAECPVSSCSCRCAALDPPDPPDVRRS
ncbi:GATOR complex protein MIOS [Pieris brassicae]|uniref:WD repeat protein mio zinc-ribbon like domain-containing protein n=1 Tax=Pieris brassicae TaxID=7116 RepID=A0A9P0TE17_PIEBR|nr:GATOR complex protein MIOS [Pieris brassicae]CAH4028135.1 unnamed protein product [Pieris brassicae]